MDRSIEVRKEVTLMQWTFLGFVVTLTVLVAMEDEFINT